MLIEKKNIDSKDWSGQSKGEKGYQPYKKGKS